jgi:hypothetical protein
MQHFALNTNFTWDGIFTWLSASFSLLAGDSLWLNGFCIVVPQNALFFSDFRPPHRLNNFPIKAMLLIKVRGSSGAEKYIMCS